MATVPPTTDDSPGPSRAGGGATPATFRAVTAREYGGPEVLALEDLPVPEPGPREVLVEVHAAAVDRGTSHLLHGTPYPVRVAFGLRRPRRPGVGRDVAGVVRAVGDEVTRFAVGDSVLGSAPHGSLAELAVAPEDRLVHRPDWLPYDEAAASTISGGTALQALDKVGVAAGDRVLVLGASGGVGSFAVRLAVGRGAEVTGVCSAAKADWVRSLGAARVVDHQNSRMLAGDLVGALGRHDVIVDVAGGHSLGRLRSTLTESGRVVLVGNETGGDWSTGVARQLRAKLVSAVVRQQLTSVIASERHEGTESLVAELATTGDRSVVSRRYPLDEAVQALRDLDAGLVAGKAVVVVRRDG
jgi:NADPH:quinone reductase-like Zn-dependent oxidoreductase